MWEVWYRDISACTSSRFPIFHSRHGYEVVQRSKTILPSWLCWEATVFFLFWQSMPDSCKQVQNVEGSFATLIFFAYGKTIFKSTFFLRIYSNIFQCTVYKLIYINMTLIHNSSSETTKNHRKKKPNTKNHRTPKGTLDQHSPIMFDPMQERSLGVFKCTADVGGLQSRSKWRLESEGLCFFWLGPKPPNHGNLRYY